MNERKEQHAINESLLWNIKGGSPHGNPLIQPTSSRKSYVINRPIDQRKKGKKNTPLNIQKEIIIAFLVIIPFLLAERNRGMMTNSKESSEI